MIAREGMTNENGICSLRVQFPVSLVNQLKILKGTVFHFEFTVMLIGLRAYDANLPFLGVSVLKFG